MSYFDAGEELLKQPPYWRNQGRFALGVQARLKKPVILEGNAIYSHLAWHVITRGSPNFDPIYFGRRRHFDPNGTVLGDVKPEGALRLAANDNRVRFTAASGPTVSPRAEVTLSLRGVPLSNARRPAAVSARK